MVDTCYCSETKTQLLFYAGSYEIVRCRRCLQVRVKGNGKKKHIYHKEDIQIYIEKEEMFRRIFRQIISYIQGFKRTGTLLDLGAGVGLLVDEAKRAGFDAVGLEPSAAGVGAAKKYFGIHLRRSVLHSRSIKNPVDIIILNHVLEHIARPDKIIQYIHASIKHNGVLVIGVPNFGSIMSRIKGNRWQSLIPDQHRWQFTLKTLDQFIERHGFKRVGLRSENHDRSIVPLWKRPVYEVLDRLALATNRGEAILLIYQKI